MKNALRDLFLMGVGAASLTKKKAEGTVKVFVKKGLIDNKAAKEVIDRFMREAGKVKNKLKKEGIKEVKRAKKKVSAVKQKTRKKVATKIKKTARRIVKITR